MENLKAALEAALFASGDSVKISRLSLIFQCTEKEIEAAFDEIAEEYIAAGHGLRALKLDNSLQLCSAPDYADCVNKVLEGRKADALSAPALEVLAAVAYFQPVTRVYIDQIRGIESSYTVSMLADKGLIEPCGRLEVPGRPILYRTTDAFLRTMNIRSLDELPVLPDFSGGEAAEKLRIAIDELKNAPDPNQISLNQLSAIDGEE